MSLAKSHYEADPAKRKVKASVLDGKLVKVKKAEYDKLEAIIDEVYADYINGETRTHIIKKLMGALYTSQDGKAYKENFANEIFAAAFARIKADTTLNREEAMSLILSRFDSIYNDCNLMGDHHAAIRALENLAKLYGIDNKNPQTEIQINQGSSGLTINFGFGKAEEGDNQL